MGIFMGIVTPPLRHKARHYWTIPQPAPRSTAENLFSQNVLRLWLHLQLQQPSELHLRPGLQVQCMRQVLSRMGSTFTRSEAFAKDLDLFSEEGSKFSSLPSGNYCERTSVP